MASSELSNLVSIGTSQVPTDLLYIADLSAGAAGSKKITLNDFLSLITRNITDGAVRWGGIATGSAPAVSGASEGSLYYNSTDQAYKASENTAAYDDLVLAIKTQTLSNKSFSSAVTVTLTNATTANIETVVDIRHESSGTPAAGFGAALRFALESATVSNRQSGLISTDWLDATDASLRSRMVLSVIDVTTARSWAQASLISSNVLQVLLGQVGAGPSAATVANVNIYGTGSVGAIDATTNTAPPVLYIEKESSGTPAAGFGAGLRFTLESSTTAGQPAGNIICRWATATHASRASILALQVYEQNTAIEGLMVKSTSGIIQIACGTNPTAPTSTDGIFSIYGSFRTVPSTLTDAATIATDASLSNNFTVTLGGNRTLGNPTNAANGQVIVWELIQDATGSRTLTLDTNFKFGTDITGVTLSTTANKRDFLTVKYSSSTGFFYVVAFVKGY